RRGGDGQHRRAGGDRRVDRERPRGACGGLTGIDDIVASSCRSSPPLPCWLWARPGPPRGSRARAHRRSRPGPSPALRAGARRPRVEVVGALVVRCHLREPWPDFMTFYGTTATAAGIVVPKRYLEQVGDDGFRKHPIGAGPYKFVSHTPGVEVVLEAYGGHWRRVPNVKRLIMKSVPEGTTRVAMLKSGEADIAYVLDGPEAEDVK